MGLSNSRKLSISLKKADATKRDWKNISSWALGKKSKKQSQKWKSPKFDYPEVEGLLSSGSSISSVGTGSYKWVSTIDPLELPNETLKITHFRVEFK